MFVWLNSFFWGMHPHPMSLGWGRSDPIAADADAARPAPPWCARPWTGACRLPWRRPARSLCDWRRAARRSVSVSGCQPNVGNLDCYWVGSLAVTFWLKFGVFCTNPPPPKKKSLFLQGGSTATKKPAEKWSESHLNDVLSFGPKLWSASAWCGKGDLGWPATGGGRKIHPFPLRRYSLAGFE